MVIGSVDLPSLLIFIRAFQAHQGTRAKIMIAASGPDQGQAFLNTLNPINAQAIMVPDGWFGGEQNALSHVMVQDYIAKFGGTTSDINADVAEAYSAGEILADAVTATHGTDNKAIISYLHSRGPAADRAGNGEVRSRTARTRRARPHLPVARRPVPPGAARERGTGRAPSWRPSRSGDRADDRTG